jgi:hypothetical protein
MYAKYVYTSGATDDQILDDTFEIFCGETDVNNLSAGCDTTNSVILTTYSTSPWVDFDDVSATERIMRLESSDDSGVYKYVGWNHDGVDELAFTIMESWDAGTDTPTNEVAVNYDKQGMGFFPGTGGTLHIYSSTFCTIIMHESTLNIWGQQRGDPTYGSLGIFECDRSHPSLALGDMPNWFLSSTAMVWGDADATMDATFWQGRDETDTVLTPFRGDMSYPGRDNQYSDSNSYPITGAAGSSTALTEIGADTTFGLEPLFVSGSFAVASQDTTTYYGNVSARCDIWMMPVGSQNCGTRVHINGLPYIVFKLGYTTSTAGAQFGGKFIVPYG